MPRNQEARTEGSQASDMMGKAAQGSWGGDVSADSTLGMSVVDSQGSRISGSSPAGSASVIKVRVLGPGCRMSGI